MTSNNLSWQEAIVRVLEDAGVPLDYQEITNRIGQQGLRPLTGATPARTVNALLSRMIKESESIYDSRVKKVGRGVFEFLSPSDLQQESTEVEETDEVEEEQPDEIRELLVPTYGMFWERDKVRWSGRQPQMLGRDASSSAPVDFADQRGVYLLHKGRSVVYVGRAIKDGLYKRLYAHYRRADPKALRWDSFSWFGLRDVDESGEGELKSLTGDFSVDDVITILESVLIEAFEPPINGRRGDRMGELYQQVIDPQIQEQLRKEYFVSLAQ